MTYEFVILERVGRVGIVTLNRPNELNTLHPGQSREMREAVLELDSDRAIGAIVMTATGRAFCAGGDVRGWNQKVQAGEAGDIMARAAQRPSGVQESWADIWRRVKPAMLLPQICGLSNAMDLMISGAIIDAAHALRVGVVNEVVPHEALRERAIQKAAEYARLHPDTTRAVKQLVWRNFLESDFAAVGQRELEAFAAAQRRPSHAEATRAFVEKREPDFYAAVERGDDSGQAS